MKYLAILKDSLYETMDQKLFYVLVVLSLVLVLVCGSFSFPRQPVEHVLQRNVGSTLRVSDVQVLEESPFSSTGRYRFSLVPGSVPDVRDLPVPGRGPGFGRPAPLPPPDLVKNPLGGISRMPGFKDATVIESTVSEDGKLQKAVGEITINWPEVLQGHKFSLLFGLQETEMMLPAGGVVTGIQITIIDYIAGLAGVTLAVIITAGFIPNMMRKGSIDLLLVKPISRPLLLVYKYLGGLSFVLLNAVVLIGTSWIVFGLTLGNWNYWYLASIGVLLFYFAVLYSLSVLVGVVTRNSLAAILVTLGFWIFMAAVGLVRTLAHDARTPLGLPEYIVQAIDAIHFVMPRLGDLSALNQYTLAEANGLTNLIDEEKKQTALKFSWTETLITSGAFIFVMLSLACWRFSRRDY